MDAAAVGNTHGPDPGTEDDPEGVPRREDATVSG